MSPNEKPNHKRIYVLWAEADILCASPDGAAINACMGILKSRGVEWRMRIEAPWVPQGMFVMRYQLTPPLDLLRQMEADHEGNFRYEPPAFVDVPITASAEGTLEQMDRSIIEQNVEGKFRDAQ